MERERCGRGYWQQKNAIIRKNRLFAGSEAGKQRLAILYNSFAATCQANNICFLDNVSIICTIHKHCFTFL